MLPRELAAAENADLHFLPFDEEVVTVAVVVAVVVVGVVVAVPSWPLPRLLPLVLPLLLLVVVDDVVDDVAVVVREKEWELVVLVATAVESLRL